MGRILLIDATGGEGTKLAKALTARQWQVVAVNAPEEARHAAGRVTAIMLVTEAGRLAHNLAATVALRTEPSIPILLAADLDRSGWDRTFSAPEALNVDALFDLPVDTQAVIARLNGILEARSQGGAGAPSGEMSIIVERAIANEEAAAAFYRRAAQSVSHADARDALEMLAKDETEHKGLLEDFRSGRRTLPSCPLPTSGLTETFGAPQFTPDLTPADAFLLAVRKERLSVAFYENWASLYPAGPERDLLLKLAETERCHEAKVSALFTNAAFPERW